MTSIPTRPPPDAAVSAFGSIDSHAALLEWSRSYACRAVDATDLAVDLSCVEWDVSTRAKRRAAAVFHPRVPETALGEPVDWASVRDELPRETSRTDPAPPSGSAVAGSTAGDPGRTCARREDVPGNQAGTADGPAPDPFSCTVRLTWGAAQAYDGETWAETVRHELIHVEQFQRFGTTGHGSQFDRRAATLETTVRCQRFATPKYVLTCPDCETVVARRYRDCKLVRRHDEYRSQCCDAALTLRRTGGTD